MWFFRVVLCDQFIGCCFLGLGTLLAYSECCGIHPFRLSLQSSDPQSFILCPVTNKTSGDVPTINLQSKTMEIDLESMHPHSISCQFTRVKMASIHIEFYLDGVKQVEFEVLPGGRMMPRSFWQIGDDVDDPGQIKVQYAREIEEVAY